MVAGLISLSRVVRRAAGEIAITTATGIGIVTEMVTRADKTR
jgi:hypothetical protein